jgi:hypothetical protein
MSNIHIHVHDGGSGLMGSLAKPALLRLVAMNPAIS